VDAVVESEDQKLQKSPNADVSAVVVVENAAKSAEQQPVAEEKSASVSVEKGEESVQVGGKRSRKEKNKKCRVLPLSKRSRNMNTKSSR
jgi:hypothetical protein